MNDIEIWLERLNSLYKSQMRHAVIDEGIQLVHFEILQYLTICNHYSNTAQALVEYLGQTKGSLSQSIKLMERDGLIKRKACREDKRVSKLHLTRTGKSVYKRVSSSLCLNCDDNGQTADLIKSLLTNWQNATDGKSFGQCKSCRYHKKLAGREIQCVLTQESLSDLDALKICREHEFLASSNVAL